VHLSNGFSHNRFIFSTYQTHGGDFVHSTINDPAHLILIRLLFPCVFALFISSFACYNEKQINPFFLRLDVRIYA